MRVFLEMEVAPIEPVPWKHQTAGIDFIFGERCKLLDMGMGTGKSRCVVQAVRQLKRRTATLILCPKKVLESVWPGEFKRWARMSDDIDVHSAIKGTSSKKVELAEAARERSRLSCRRFVLLVNYETSFRPDMLAYLQRPWAMVVLDESQKIKDPKGSASKAAHRIGKRAYLRVCLSGTPTPHGPLDIFAQYRFLDESVFGDSFAMFKARYAQVGVIAPKGLSEEATEKLNSLIPERRAVAIQLMRTAKFRSPFRGGMRRVLDAWLYRGGNPLSEQQWNGFGIIDWKKLQEVVGYQNMEEYERKVAKLSYSVSADDVLDLPPKRHVYRTCILEPKARKIYHGLDKDMVATLESGEEITIDAILQKVLRLQQVTSGFLPVEPGGFLSAGSLMTDPKTGNLRARYHAASGDALEIVSSSKRDLLQEDLESIKPTEPVVVFGKFRYDMDAIKHAAEAAGREYLELSGRDDGLEEWQSSEGGQVLGVQISSGGVGISLVRASYCCYYGITFVLGDYDQSLARVWRPGQERSVTYLHYVVADTIDGRIYQALTKRKNMIEEIWRNVGKHQNKTV